MPIDARARAWCSLGPLSTEPVTLSETHLQGSGGGVIKVTGTVNLAGIVRPTPGDEVYFAASDGQNWICRLPRKLRVLNSFADPIRNITTVAVGCKFAYLENRKIPLVYPNAIDATPEMEEAERLRRTQSISAAFVAQHILDKLGLTAASSIPFTNYRITDWWDLSSGYVQSLATIAEAECYRCRLNENEQVEFISLRQEISTAPLLTENQIIDITPQTVGELPAELVYAKYQRTRLKTPQNQPPDSDTVRKRNWELDESWNVEQYVHTGPDGIEKGSFVSSRKSESEYDAWDRLTSRTETTIGLTGTTIATTSYKYEAAPPSKSPSGVVLTDPNQDYTVVKEEYYTQKSPLADIAGVCGFEGSLSELRSLGTFTSSRRVTEFERDKTSGITRTITRNFVPFSSTPFGSDAIQKSAFDSSVEELLVIASGLTEYGSETNIRTEREYGLRRRPGQQERNRSADQQEPPTVQYTNFTWDTGSLTSQTQIELSPPYVSDDRLVRTTVNGVTQWQLVLSDAAQKALSYARTENRLLLGNRAGPGIQLRLIDAPSAPFDLFYIRMNGCTAAYRVNGTTWTISDSGIVVSIDALFWGAIDGNINNAWFPLPTGVTSLPTLNTISTNADPKPANAIAIPQGFNPFNVNLSALFALLPVNQPAVPAATLNPSTIVKPYTETLPVSCGISVGLTYEAMLPDLPATTVTGGVTVGAIYAFRYEAAQITAGVEVGVMLAGETVSTLLFLLQMTGSNGSTVFTDLSTNEIPITAYGNAQINNNELLLDGNGDYIVANSSLLALPGGESGAWTIEGFVTPFTVPYGWDDWVGVLSLSSDDIDFISLSMINAEWTVGEYGFTNPTGITASANTKVHFAFVFSNYTFKTFINGSMYSSLLNYFEEFNGATANKLALGRVFDDGSGSYVDFNGKIGPIRITSEVLYTDNFTPPTSFPNP